MQQSDKIKLKAQLQVLMQGRVSGCQTLLFGLKNLANVGAITPSGPVDIPALGQMVIALEMMNQTDGEIMKLVSSLIDAA
jgi:hypothetical protein